MKTRLLLLAITTLYATNLWPDQPVVLGEESIGQVLISPSGTHLAMVREAAQGDAVFVVNKARKKVLGRYLLPEQTHIHQIGWVDDSSLVVEVAASPNGNTQQLTPVERLSLLSLPSEEGALAVVSDLQTTIDDKPTYQMSLIDALPKLREEVLVRIPNDGDEDGLYLLNTTSHEATLVARSSGSLRLLSDPLGQRLLGFQLSDAGVLEIQLFDNGSWQTLDLDANRLLPIRLTSDKLYLLGTGESPDLPIGLYSLDLTDGGLVLQFRDDAGSIDRVFFDGTTGTPMAARYLDGFPNWHHFGDDAAANLHVAVSAALPDEDVVPVSATLDGTELVFRSRSVQQPGSFYLVNTKSRDVSVLAKVRPRWGLGWDVKTSSTQPFSVRLSDGRSTSLFITEPEFGFLGRKNAPAVLFVDDFAPTSWSYNEEMKILTDLDITVLQLGLKPSLAEDDAEIAGFQKLDLTGQDLQAVINALVADETINRSRLCLIGRGSGGDAVLDAMALDPDLVRCVIASGTSRATAFHDWPEASNRDLSVCFCLEPRLHRRRLKSPGRRSPSSFAVVWTRN